MRTLRLLLAAGALLLGLAACGETGGTTPTSSLSGVQQQSLPSAISPDGSYPAPAAVSSPESRPLSSPEGSYPPPSAAP